MKSEPQFFGTQVHVSDFEMIYHDMDVIKRMVEDKVARQLAQHLVENKVVKMVEAPDFTTNSKTFRAEVVVLDRDEYRRLREIESTAGEAKKVLSKIY